MLSQYWQNSDFVGGKRGSPKSGTRRSPRTDLCHFNKPHKSCRLSSKGRRLPEHKAYVRAHTSPAQRSQRDRFSTFARESRGHKGKGATATHVQSRHQGQKSRGSRGSRGRRGQGGGGYLMEGGKRGSPKGGKRASPRTDLCHYYEKTTRCHKSAKATRDYPRTPTAPQRAARARFAAAARKTRGEPNKDKRNAIIRRELGR